MSKFSIEVTDRTPVVERALPSAGNGIHDELESLLLEVGFLANHLKKAARRIHQKDHLPAGAKSLLQMLAQHGPQTVPQLARARSTSRQNIQMLMNRLESMGHVDFLPNPAHQRSDLIRVTEEGRALLGTATQREANLLAPLLAHVSEEEILSSAALLSRLRQLLAGHPLDEPSSATKKKRKSARTYRKQLPGPAREQNVIAAAMRPTLEPTPPSPSEEVELPVSLL